MSLLNNSEHTTKGSNASPMIGSGGIRSGMASLGLTPNSGENGTNTTNTNSRMMATGRRNRRI